MFAAGVSCSTGLHFMTAAQFPESWKTLTRQYEINSHMMFSIYIPDFMSLQTIGWAHASINSFKCIYLSIYFPISYIFLYSTGDSELNFGQRVVH